MEIRPSSGRKISLGIAMATMLVGGCSQRIALKIDSDVPDVLVQTLPLTVGVYYDDSLRHHRYIENSDDRPDWLIESGASQVAMFDRVFTSTFAHVVPLDRLPSADAPVELDLVFVPEIQEMQFAIPSETYYDYYEAWFRYDIDLLTGTGMQIAKWEITAYGKAPKTRFGGQADDLNQAIGLALRDIGAKLSTGLPDHPVVKQLLEVER
ncbi:MAG: hypothetical protein E2O36_05895 [Proteobacteria bacterium]|nr:MAG: hypothetical protein E2O36_05895 [Pseudomonadota bacterium]